MGHGYFAVFGWGAVVPLEKFAEVFPEAFRWDHPRSPDPNEEEMEHLAMMNDVSFFYQHQDTPKNIFICSKEYYEMDVRAEGGESEVVDFNYLNQHLQELRIFIAENFPEVTVVNPMLYAYEGS